MSLLPRGVHPIIYALFDATGDLDRQAMRRQIEVCIAQGAVGIVALGLATEVRFLSDDQQRQIVEWCVADIAGRVPLGVTIFGQTPDDQIERVNHAAAAGADWAVLQPPASVTDETGLVAAFSRVLEASPLPAALQNMPQFLGVGLSVEAIADLAARHKRVIGVKQEVSATETAELVARLAGRAQVLSGRGGIELVDCMTAGVAGHIPAPECADYLVALWDHMSAGREEEARDVYARVLPMATFVLQSLEALTTYGKLLFCLRHEIAFHQRAGAMAPTEFGLKALEGHARGLGIDTSGWDARLASVLKS
ncbi:dihydrodipicolinate synthase family protein [Devosia nitrariae]|uniref:Dihydrodipicolinate synthase family protein n=1 Tax=Devosia nitrariae TaxID=2071872 RepID=A0ABQ5W1X1_9HYPH|nr:dihydrodipicolinate synthase family protein [Devosia nitrariae]GLQ53871.1 dihydrodipicolinate synthase family protein [Devosia nitrariae]